MILIIAVVDQLLLLIHILCTNNDGDDKYDE